MISALKPTSKASLKMQCLIISRGNVKEAKELYDFYSSDMQALPDFDVEPPTWTQNAKESAIGIFNFMKENKEDIMQGIDFIRSILSKNGAIPTVETPQALPPINE